VGQARGLHHPSAPVDNDAGKSRARDLLDRRISPVTGAWLTLDWPARTAPSTGIRRQGETMTVSVNCTSLTAIR
jgi:hypothetical protein